MKKIPTITLRRHIIMLMLFVFSAFNVLAVTRAIDVSGGTTTYATMPHQSYLSAMTNMTAEAWINTTNSTSTRFFFSKYISSQRATGGEWYMAVGSGGTSLVIMVVPAGDGGTGGARTFNLPDQERYDDGKWHHVAFTYDESRIEVFYDGVSLGVNTQTSGAIRGNMQDINIGVIKSGVSPANNDNSFIGLVGDVRLWDIIRTEAEISANMNCRLSGDETGLVGYWPLDEAAGTVIYDLTSHVNDGELVGDVVRWSSQGTVITIR